MLANLPTKMEMDLPIFNICCTISNLIIKEPSMQAHRRAFKYFYCEVSDMKKAASIFLRAEIEMNDIELLIRWMKNPNVTRYLNEDPNAEYLRRQS